MSNIQLTNDQTNTLDQACKEKIEDAFGRLGSFFQQNQWIALTNRYCNNIIQNLWDDQGNPIHSDLTEYIAASVPLHCADGWNFLGKALFCHSRGDSDSSRHLAYYAELRAAMSLLAAEGVGIFNNQHYIIDNQDICQRIPMHENSVTRKRKWLGTHEIAWLALKHWAGSQILQSDKLLGEIIRPGAIELKDWLKSFTTRTNFQIIGKEWLELWGLDLERLSEDHIARNDSSYRPTRLNARQTLGALTCSNFLRELWSLHEPLTYSPFEMLDRHLLRLSLRKAYDFITRDEDYSSANNNTHLEEEVPSFEAKIEHILKTIQPREVIPDEWQKFLIMEPSQDTPLIIDEAEKNEPIENPKHHIQVIARAALLLRIATGACARLIKRANFRKENFEFWWKPYGESKGLWERDKEPTELTDLWTDIEEAVLSLKEWEDNNSTTLPSMYQWHIDLTPEISVLSSCDRIALWGLGL